MTQRLADFTDDSLYDDADVSTEPFASQQAFGRGLWKNPVTFVPPASPASESSSKSKAQIMREAYIKIFFPNGLPEEAHPLCKVCGAPIREADPKEHFSSLAHQAALPPPVMRSSIDRSRMGLKYLEKYGFDVDARVGLGASGQGILFPIIPKVKRNTLGLGTEKKEEDRNRAQNPKASTQNAPKNIGAGKIRKMAKEEKKRHEKLQRMFYGNDEVEKYLEELDG